MSGPDLVAAGYPLSNPLKAILGLANLTQPNLPARSNAEYLGLSTLTDGALAATGVGCFVAVPVDVGTPISEVSILVGATAGATMTHQFAALYTGTSTPALIAQSTDTTSAAIAASGRAPWTLASVPIITQAMAPNGFIYAEVAITAATIPTAATVSVPTAVGYQWSTNGPLFLSATAGSSLGATAAATIASPAAKAVAPIVILR